MKTFMFPGQGSQARGMGGNLFDEFSELTERADKILGYSIKELCLSDTNRELSKTQFTQPALYVVNALSYFKRIKEEGVKPDYVAGHSLGEFNALLAAECFDFETGLKLVKKRGELMSQASGGAMAAILSLTRDQVQSKLTEHGLKQVDIANYNTPMQIVISGPEDEIASCQNVFQYDNVMYIPLNTSGAFHSRLMQPAQAKFESYLKKFKFAAPKIPVIANITASPYGDESVTEYLAKQICSTVLWSDSVAYLLDISSEMEFVEIGHGDVLSKMIAKIRTQLPKQVKAADPIVVSIRSEGEAVKSNPRSVAENKVADWNARYPAGTKVKSLVQDYGELTTRSNALVLFGHRAAIYMEGYNGYFALDEIAAV